MLQTNSYRFWSWLIFAALALCQGGYGQPRLQQVGQLRLEFTKAIEHRGLSFQCMDYRGDSCIVSYNRTTHELNLFPLTGGKPLKVTSLAEKAFGQIRSIQNWKKDSLLIYAINAANLSKELYLLAADGGRRYLNYGSHLQLEGEDEEREALDLQGFYDLHIHGDWAYTRILPYLKLNQMNGRLRDYLIRINLRSGEFQRLPLYHPKVYYQQDYRLLFDLTQVAFSDQCMAVGYMGHPRVYLYHFDTGRVDTLQLRSEQFHLERPPLDDPQSYNLLATARSGAYGRIIFDPYQQLWFRLVHPPYPQPSEADYKDLPSSLMVYDKDWNKLAEEPIGPGYFDRNLFVCPEGLALYDLNKMDQESQEVVFDLFRFQEK